MSSPWLYRAPSASRAFSFLLFAKADVLHLPFSLPPHHHWGIRSDLAFPPAFLLTSDAYFLLPHYVHRLMFRWTWSSRASPANLSGTALTGGGYLICSGGVYRDRRGGGDLNGRPASSLGTYGGSFLSVGGLLYTTLFGVGEPEDDAFGTSSCIYCAGIDMK